MIIELKHLCPLEGIYILPSLFPWLSLEAGRPQIVVGGHRGNGAPHGTVLLRVSLDASSY